MEVEYCLSCALAVILHDIKSITVKLISHLNSEFFCKLKNLTCNFFIKLIDVSVMLLRQNKTMSLCCRSCIHNYCKCIIFINYICRDFPVSKLTENTIVLFHFILLKQNTEL